MSVVDEGEREGLLEVDAGRMIRQVIELHDEDVAAVMTPRTEMRTIPAAATLEEARVLFLDGGHSRLPVCGDDIDDVRGVLYAKDLLRALGDRAAAAPETLTVEQIARPAVFVPDTTRLDTLLSRMKREQTHLAMVVDEYGGVAGLVTLEDLLEEIVGEIVDEHDPDDEAGLRHRADRTDPRRRRGRNRPAAGVRRGQLGPHGRLQRVLRPDVAGGRRLRHRGRLRVRRTGPRPGPGRDVPLARPAGHRVGRGPPQGEQGPSSSRAPVSAA